MKPYTSVLLSLAKESLAKSESEIGTEPHSASFDAQLCAERAVKAAAFEFGPFTTEKEFDRVAHDVGHNSLKACLPVIKASVMTGIDRASNEQRRTVVKASNAGRVVRSMASLMAPYTQRVAKHFAEDAFKQMEDVMSRAWRRKGNWKRSLDMAFDPTVAVNRPQTDIHLDLGTRSVISLYKSSMHSLGVTDKDAYNIEGSSPDEPFRFLDAMVKDLKARGRDDLLPGIERSISNITKVVGPNRELLGWVKFAGTWCPYLDAHAVPGRYPTSDQLAYYRDHIEAVKRLVGVARSLLERTTAILPLAEGLGGKS